MPCGTAVHKSKRHHSDFFSFQSLWNVSISYSVPFRQILDTDDFAFQITHTFKIQTVLNSYPANQSRAYTNRIKMIFGETDHRNGRTHMLKKL
ncbi:hypothetical protein SDC9_186811 [bioreactor metagenome]|uniref:Uncharacterized protein n=1 Tax=bioreactor metagenome TaxID=1076179 RepID=A0A645HV90_9ZZZZ